MPSRASGYPISRQGSGPQHQQGAGYPPPSQQHPSTPGAYPPFRYPPSTAPPHNPHESDPTSPLTTSFGGSPGRQSQANSPPDPHHPQDHPPGSPSAAAESKFHYQPAYVSASGYSAAMPMYNGGPGGAAAAPYPGAGGFHPHHGPRGGGAVGGPPPQGYMVQPMSYVVTGPPGSGPPPGYTMAYATTGGAMVAPPGFSSGPPSGETDGGVRSSPSHHGAPPQYRHAGHERSPSGGASAYVEHTMYRPPPSTRPPSQRPPVEDHPERGYGAPPPPQHHSGAPHHLSAPHHHYAQQPMHGLPSRHGDPSRPPIKEDPSGPSSRHGGGLLEMDKQTAAEIQAERDRQAAEYELSLSRVKPIQSDYHWFAQDTTENGKEGVPAEIENDLYLRNSYLNARMKSVWETMEQDERMEFLKREEADRRRFTEEEEVASRHCATLTARAPSANSPSRQAKDKRASPVYYNNNDSDESPSKRNKVDHPDASETAPESSSSASKSS